MVPLSPVLGSDHDMQNNMVQQVDKLTQISRYLSLPAELRQKISFHALQPMFDGVEAAMTKHQLTRRAPVRTTHTILLICRQTYTEARDVMRRQCSLRLENIWMVNVDVPAFISVGTLSNITRLEISDRGYILTHKGVLGSQHPSADRHAAYRHWLFFLDAMAAFICEAHTLTEYVLIRTGSPALYNRVDYSTAHNLLAALPQLSMFRDVDKVTLDGYFPDDFADQLKLEMTSSIEARPLHALGFEPIKRSKTVRNSLVDGPGKYEHASARAQRLVERADFTKQRGDLFLLVCFSSHQLNNPRPGLTAFGTVFEVSAKIIADQYKRGQNPGVYANIPVAFIDSV